VKLKSFSTNNKNNNKKNNVGGAWGPVSGSKKLPIQRFRLLLEQTSHTVNHWRLIGRPSTEQSNNCQQRLFRSTTNVKLRNEQNPERVI